MKVVDIIKEYLRGHGFDGLYNAEEECGCRLDDLSLAFCESYVLTCMPGVLKPGNEEVDWLIGPRVADEDVSG